MPATLARACSHYGCSHSAPCPDHGQQAKALAYDDRRGSASSRGYDRHWRQYTQQFRNTLVLKGVSRAGLCGARLPGTPETADSQCQASGYVTIGTVVDHIVPISGRYDPRFYDPTNHQLLCDRCHNVKRQKERST
jgi:5-methylcytosine-specific restriction endonuclease McrA